MKKIVTLAAALAVMMLGGCATYTSDGYYSYGWYDPWGDGRDGRHSRSYGGGRSEPGNEAGMFPGRPGDGRPGGSAGGGGGGSRGGEAGSR